VSKRATSRQSSGARYSAPRRGVRNNPYHVYVDRRLVKSFADIESAELFYNRMMRGPYDRVALVETKPGQAVPTVHNPKGAFQRCVEELTARGGASDPRAVCAAAGRRKYGQAEMTRRAKAGKRAAARGAGKRNPRNPLDASDAAYEQFHGEGPEGTTTIEWQEHWHTHVWAVGDLVSMYVLLPASRRESGLSNIVTIHFDHERPKERRTFLDANEKGTQMFIDGGDQRVNLADFGLDASGAHETVVLGSLKRLDYFTTKTHLGKEGGTAVYKHMMGEEGGELPTVVYHTIDKKLAVVGGSYTMPTEGIRN
jgi:hypothetical protein